MTLRQREVRLTRAARNDLRRIAQHIRKSDAQAAERFITDLVAQIHHIARIGVTGSTRAFLPPGVRAFPYRDRCFYFTVEESTLTVLRVLHGAQDTADTVFEPEEGRSGNE